MANPPVSRRTGSLSSIGKAIVPTLRRDLLVPGAALIALLALPGLAPSPAQACETRPVADGAASFDSCGTPWGWVRSGDGEDVYVCENEACSTDTILQLSRSQMTEDDAALDRDALLADWTERVVPDRSGDYAIEMISPITVERIGGTTGIVIPLELTHSDGNTFTSVAYRVPLGDDYFIANATGDTDLTVLRGFLSLAVEKMELTEAGEE